MGLKSSKSDNVQGSHKLHVTMLRSVTLLYHDRHVRVPSMTIAWSHQRLFWGWHWNSDQERSQWFSSSSSSLNFCRTENGEVFDLCGNILDLQWQFSILAWPSSHMPAIVEGALLNVCTCIRKCCTLTSSALA